MFELTHFTSGNDAALATTSFTSDVFEFQLYGNRTGIFQVNCSSGDTVVLESRLSPEFNWVTILTITDEDAQQEIILAPQFRVRVTNTSGSAVKAAMHI